MSRKEVTLLLCIYTFLALGGGGYILLTFIAGEISDFADNAIDVVGNAIENGLESLLGLVGINVDLNFGGDAELGSNRGPGPFSFRTMVMFATGFGVGGLLGYASGLPDLLTLIPAFGSGFVLGLAGYLLLRLFWKGQGSTDITPTDYIGLLGTIFVSIPQGKMGQVAVSVKMHRRHLPAKSIDGSAIGSGTKVFIVSVDEGGVCTVRKN